MGSFCYTKHAWGNSSRSRISSPSPSPLFLFYEVRPHHTTGEEIREDRYLNLLWPQIVEIHDLHFGAGYGSYFTDQKPLTLAERFGGSGKQWGQKKQKS